MSNRPSSSRPFSCWWPVNLAQFGVSSGGLVSPGSPPLGSNLNDCLYSFHFTHPSPSTHHHPLFFYSSPSTFFFCYLTSSHSFPSLTFFACVSLFPHYIYFSSSFLFTLRRTTSRYTHPSILRQRITCDTPHACLVSDRTRHHSCDASSRLRLSTVESHSKIT